MPEPPRPTADLFERDTRPELAAEGLDSEPVFEAWREDVDDWGKARDCQVLRMWRWMRDVGLPAPPLPEVPDYCGEAPGG